LPCVGRVSTRHGRLKSALRHAILVSCGRCFTLKHETCVPCVGWVSTRHGRLKSALRHAILVGCGRCFRLKHETCVPCVGKGFNPPWPTEVGPTTCHSCRLWALFQVKSEFPLPANLTFMFNKDTPKHETCVPCVGRVSTRHGRLKSALRHATFVGCGRCLTLTPRRISRAMRFATE